MDDWELLQEYAQRGSEGSFRELVNRHLGLVYSAALRQVNDPALAEEICQAALERFPFFSQGKPKIKRG